MKIGQIRATLGKAIAYVADAYKTEGRTLVSTNAVMDPSDVAGITAAFREVQRMADESRGGGRPPSVLGVHLIQSFSPGEVGPEQAHALGVEFVERVTSGEYQYVVATHVDRHHVHNHIIFNPCSMRTLKRWRSPRGRLAELRAISDDLCRDRGLSVVDEPGRGAVSIGEVYARARGESTKDNLRALVDEAVLCSGSMEQLRERLGDAGVEASSRRGSLMLRDSETMGRAVRSERLGAAYGQAALVARLGRECRREFIVSRAMVEDLNDLSVVVRARGLGGGLGVVVSRSDLVDNETGFRVFLSENCEHTLVDRAGRYGGVVSVEEIAGVLLAPSREIPVPDGWSSPRTERGASQSQRRYFAVVDRKVEALRRDMEVLNVEAVTRVMSDEDLDGYVAGLGDGSRAAQRSLAQALVAQQQGLDEGVGEAESAALERSVQEAVQRVRRIERERKIAVRKHKERGR